VDNITTVFESPGQVGVEVFVGMDVDKASIATTTRDHLGLGRSVKMPYDPDVLLSFMRNHYPNKHAAFVYEAGPTGFGLYDAIVDAGFKCLVVAPSMVPRTPGKRVKTNRLDSVKLAELLRGGQLEGIRVPAGKYRELREMTGLRNTQVDDIRSVKYRIKSLLLRNSLAFPEAPASSQWSRLVISGLRTMQCPGVLRFKMDSLLDELEWRRAQLLRTQVQLRQMLESDSELSESMRYLTSIPGVGWIIGSYVLARVGDWRLLGSSDEMGAFFGLVPSENSTGDSSDRGSITKCGDKRLRSMLIQGAWAAIRKDPELREFYNRVYATHPRHTAARIAIVAVARKMAGRMHCVLRERREYQVRALGSSAG
jgi:transposase